MKLLGVINEPPFDPVSWSGTSRHFFGALDKAGILAGALDVQISPLADRVFRALNVAAPLSRWKERYHLDSRRFQALTREASRRIKASGIAADGVLQIGAWYCLPDATELPCYSYHDGNLALRVRAGHVGVPPSHPRLVHAMRWERETYAKLKGLFVMSAWLGDSFARDFGVPRDRIHVVGAGINFEHIPPERIRTDFAPRFLMVGRDFQRKGGELLLQAFAQVRQKLPAAELVLIGPQMSAPPPGVRCLGYLSKRLPEHVALLEKSYADAGIYVLPSLYEPFGISLLEAMAHSLPCIAANHCAMPEIVLHNSTGLIVNPGDADSLAQGMLTLASDPAMALAFCAAGRRRLAERYNWDAVAQHISTVVS
jgi:glycosyltransferase involved in cell wall biosynthesis